ncbi:MAG: class I SAM-dependent methyltransferase, partial [Polaromonas sp.]
MTNPPILTTDLHTHIAKAIDAAGGWLGFDQFMALALYTPGLGYYANDSRKFGLMPAAGSDFVTAPELSPRFGQTLARQVAQALQATGTAEVWEFGAGSGALALQMLDTLGPQLERYTIVDL